VLDCWVVTNEARLGEREAHDRFWAKADLTVVERPILRTADIELCGLISANDPNRSCISD
jgi:hypothetical protein